MVSVSTRPPIIDPEKSYTFSDYFKLNPPIDELIQYFGYQYQTQNYQLPQIAVDEAHFAHLYRDLNESLLIVDLTNETARREALISPILLAVARYLKVRVRIEYVINVTNQLKGTLDYLLQKSGNFLVVEAKDESLRRGFIQLSTELIAMDLWHTDESPLLYGAVSVGDVWQFGVLNRETKTIFHDINLFRVPADLNGLLRVLMAILR